MKTTNFLNVFNEGLSKTESNAVRGGSSKAICTCAGGGTLRCPCLVTDHCICNGEGTVLDSCGSNAVCGQYTCSTDKKPGPDPGTEG